MTQTITRTAGIVLLAAPEGRADELIQALSKADMECVQAINAESCLSLVKSVFPNAILIDLGLSQEDCRKIITGLDDLIEGRTIPVVLLVQVTDLDLMKSQFLSTASDIVFKPVRYDELVTRLELIKAKFRQGEAVGGDEVQHKMISAARKACHELNQPLQYILGSVQLALLDISPEDSVYEVMRGLRQQSERMAQIAADLMRLLRLMG